MSGWTWSVAAGPEYDDSHVVEALADRLFQDKELPRLESYISIIAARWQVVEDLLWQMVTERNLEDAVGVQLDGLGDILDESRGGLTDDQYRPFLKAKVLVLRSRGRVEELVNILEVLGYTEIVVREMWPAHLQIEIFDVVLAVETNRIIRMAKAGGVGLKMIFSTVGSDETFRASSIYGGDDTTTANGAGSVYKPSVGGSSAWGMST